MNIENLVNSLEIHKITERHFETQRHKFVYSWNIFTMSSYHVERENFHSDVIGSLLDPQGLHMDGDIFLMNFIDYLNALLSEKIIEKKVLK